MVSQQRLKNGKMHAILFLNVDRHCVESGVICDQRVTARENGKTYKAAVGPALLWGLAAAQKQKET